MQHYLKFAGLFFGSIALASLVIGLLSAIAGLTGLVLLGFALLTAFVALAIGAVILFIHGVRCARQVHDPLQRVVAVLASPVLAVAVLLAMAPLALFGHYVGRLANPVLERPRYDVAPPPITVQPAPPEYRAAAR